MSWLLLLLLPPGFRAEFGEEMLLTLASAANDVRGPWNRARFWARELRGWIGLALLQHARGDAPARHAGRRGVVAVTVAGLAGGLVLWLGGTLVASHGIYWRAAHPVATAAIALLGAAIGWELAGASAARARLWRCSGLLFLLLATLPAFRIADHHYLSRAATHGGVSFTLPGIEVRSEVLPPDAPTPTPTPAPIQGFQATRHHVGSGGVRLRTVWERRPDAPPYLVLALLLLLSASLAAHATRLRLIR